MARIAGVDLPRDKRVEIGLTYIFGIGRPTANAILEKTGINKDTRVRDLSDEEVQKLRDEIDKTLKVEGDLRREIALNIKRLIEIGSFRGVRHRKGLPVRGQRSKTNARTRKGPRRTVAGKKKKEVYTWRLRLNANRLQPLDQSVGTAKMLKWESRTFARRLTTPLLRSRIQPEMRSVGRVLVVWDSKALAKARHLQRKWLQNLPVRLRWNTA